MASSRTKPLTGRVLAGSVYDEQLKLEQECLQKGKQEYWKEVAEAVARGEGANLKPAARMVIYWYEAVRDTIKLHRRHVAKGEEAGGLGKASVTALAVDADRAAAIVCQSVLSACLRDLAGAKLSAICHEVGVDVLTEVAIDQARTEFRKQDRKIRKTALWRLRHKYRKVTPALVRTALRREMVSPVLAARHHYRIGAWLVSILQSEAIVPGAKTRTLAFRIDRQIRRGKNGQPIIVLRSEVMDIIEHGHAIREYLRPKYMPMLHVPNAWSKEHEGGYNTIRTPLMAAPTRAQKQAIENAGDTMDRVYAAINAMQSVPMRINCKILDVQRALLREGGAVAGLERVEDEPKPPHPPEYNPDGKYSERWTLGNTPAKRAYKLEAARVIKANIRRRSTAKLQQEAVNAATRVAGKAIYFPVQMCFRGRQYPIPVDLHYQGPDTWMGLLEFDRGVDVTDDGMAALCLELANCWGHGMDKTDDESKMKWALSQMEHIIASGRDPLGYRWWTGSEDAPFQFLAACMAIAEPETCGRHAAVQLDGSANGYQHYAAMGRDPLLASLVNLLDDSLSSPYIAVADVVRSKMQADAAKGVMIRGYRLDGTETMIPVASVLQYASPKVVKTSVMTKPYSVTRRGMSIQVSENMRRKIGTDSLSESECRAVANYVSKLVDDAIGEVAKSASDIMTWLKSSARKIVEAGHLPQWTTPMGLPVVQDGYKYRIFKHSQIRTCMGAISVIVAPTGDEPSRIRKHINGISPNVVHSIDGSHMQLAALESARRGMDLVGKHDAYRGHASHRDALRRTTLETFVETHRQPFHYVLHKQWEARYPDIQFSVPPEIGTFDVASVLDRKYAFA